MLTNISESIRRKNAEFIRDVEYIKEMAYEDMLDDRLESVMENEYDFSYESLKSDLIAIESISDDEDDELEIQRIMESTTDLTFNDMIGITESVKDDMEESGDDYDF